MLPRHVNRSPGTSTNRSDTITGSAMCRLVSDARCVCGNHIAPPCHPPAIHRAAGRTSGYHCGRTQEIYHISPNCWLTTIKVDSNRNQFQRLAADAALGKSRHRDPSFGNRSPATRIHPPPPPTSTGIGSPVQLWTLSAFGINDDVRGCDACSGYDTEYEIDNLFNNRQSSARTWLYESFIVKRKL